MVDLEHLFFVRLLLYCLFIAWHCCRDLFRYLQAVVSNTLISKNACWALSQNPRALMSSLASFYRFWSSSWSSSPKGGNNFGSFLYLCKHLILLLQWDHVFCSVWWSQNHLSYSSCCAEYQIYVCMDKMWNGSQPYCELIESQNCCFDSLKPCSVIVNIVRQFDTPFSVLILTSRFFFSFICNISSCKQHRCFPCSVFHPVLVVWLFSHWCYIECFDLLLRWLVRLISNCFLRTNLFIIW